MKKDDMNDKLDQFLVPKSISIKEAMRRMDSLGEKILFVVDDKNKLNGSLSDGDIRRWVLKNGTLSEPIEKVFSKDPISVDNEYNIDSVKQLMLQNKIEWIPVIDQANKICDVLLWGKVFGNGQYRPKEKIDLPVVIMAGGKGTRLDPFTKVLPKPLIPIGEKTILEMIMEKFERYGINEFYLSINHKAKMVKAFFQETTTPYMIHYVEEKKPLGTAGSLRLIINRIKTSLIVSNCDILIDSDYTELVDFHNEGNYDITIVGSFRHFQIPYGICEIESGGRLKSIHEKPEYDYLVNTGMYIVKKEVLSMIPRNEYYNFTDLINQVKDSGGNVGVFPIDEKSWIDIGQWDEYRRATMVLDKV